MCWPSLFTQPRILLEYHPSPGLLSPRVPRAEVVGPHRKPCAWISRPSEKQFWGRLRLLDRSLGTAPQFGRGEIGTLALSCARRSPSFLRTLAPDLAVDPASERLGRHAQSVIAPQVGRT